METRTAPILHFSARSVFGLCVETSTLLSRLNSPGKVGREVALVTRLKVRALPIISPYTTAAILRAAVAIEFVIRLAVAHSIIHADFLTSRNIAHGDQTDLPGEARIRLAGMIETISRFQLLRCEEIQTFIDL